MSGFRFCPNRRWPVDPREGSTAVAVHRSPTRQRPSRELPAFRIPLIGWLSVPGHRATEFRKATAKNRRDQAGDAVDLKMPRALEAVDDILTQAYNGGTTASEAIEQLLGTQIELRNNRRLDSSTVRLGLESIRISGQSGICRVPKACGMPRGPIEEVAFGWEPTAALHFNLKNNGF